MLLKLLKLLKASLWVDEAILHVLLAAVRKVEVESKAARMEALADFLLDVETPSLEAIAHLKGLTARLATLQAQAATIAAQQSSFGILVTKISGLDQATEEVLLSKCI